MKKIKRIGMRVLIIVLISIFLIAYVCPGFYPEAQTYTTSSGIIVVLILMWRMLRQLQNK
jgi:hypothetical protein